MNRFVHVLTAILLTGAFTIFSPPMAGAVSGKSMVERNNAFAVKLYRELGTKQGNLFFSPYSVSTALGMTYAGARGNTAKEMAEALCFEADQAKLHLSFKALSRELAASAQQSGQKLNIANALILTGGDVSREFKAVAKDSYAAEIFGGDLDSVNNWVKRKTEGKIERILEELSPDSVCVLLNAIYFKGTWESRFGFTFDAPFSVSESRKATVPLMHQKSDFRLLKEKDFQAVSLPYKGNNLSMVVLLPDSVDGLAGLEKRLTAENLESLLEKLTGAETQKVDVYLPRFRLETGYDLASPFRSMGMKDAFMEKYADFSGMGWQKGRLWIGQIKHKAFVDVNEEGTEAAAGTAVEMVTKIMTHEPVFRADHPFLFIIRDNRSGSIVFMGRIVEPASST